MTTPDTNDRRWETRVSWIILCCLVGIGAGVFLKQFSFNPAVLVATQLAQIKGTGAATSAESVIDPAWLPTALKEFGAPEHFTSENLYDKIDGKAELYASVGVTRMDCQRFALKDAPDEWFEWFVYGMNGGPQAFSVFSTQRRAEGQTLELTPYAYQTQNALFFVAGTNYIEAVGSSASDPLHSAMLAMAQRFVTATSASAGQMPEMELLPTAGMVAGSVTLQASDAFGFDGFKNVFSARYDLNGKELMAFVSACPTASAATALRDGYRAFLLANGGKDLAATSGELGKAVEIMGGFELIFCRGNYVAGIHSAPTSAAAEQIGSALQKRLVEKIK